MDQTQNLPEVEPWPRLQPIGIFEFQRRHQDTIEVQHRYYLLSGNATAQDFAHAARSHWQIEKSPILGFRCFF